MDDAANQTSTVSADQFWLAYRSEIQKRGDWEAYRSASSWTPIAVEMAQAACVSLGLLTSKEYLRLDARGYTANAERAYDWDLKVAIEVENNGYWEDELCKLSHVVADLRVLIAYQLTKRYRQIEWLNKILPIHAARIGRVQNSAWLFIFGPIDLEDEWEAWAMTPDCILSPLHSKLPLCAADMPCFSYDRSTPSQ